MLWAAPVKGQDRRGLGGGGAEVTGSNLVFWVSGPGVVYNFVLIVNRLIINA